MTKVQTVLIEGPSCGDARFISEWLSRALKADEILQKMRLTDRDLFERIDLLEVVYMVEFAEVALACVRKWFRTSGAFTFNIPHSEWSDMLAVIADLGFLTQTVIATRRGFRCGSWSHGGADCQ